jgi:cobaltochelatase CobS
MSNNQQTTLRPVQLPLGATFGLSGVSEAAKATGFVGDSPYTPKANPNYRFRKDHLRALWMFLQNPDGDAFYITGPTGSGKTSLVTEYAARVNWPVQQVTAHGRMEMQDLVGFYTLQSASEGETPSMRFQYGPLARAMRDGHILLINEIDLMDPSDLAGLNDVLEGRPLVLAANGGEVINPHPAFRVVVTANSRGQGDMTGLYSGIKAMNVASMDRYRMIEVGYPEADVELAILSKVAPVIPEPIAMQMVELANKVRNLFIGGDSGEGSLSVTMSTRTLVRWAKLTATLSQLASEKPLSEALAMALLNRCQAEEAEAINRMAVLEFGDNY